MNLLGAEDRTLELYKEVELLLAAIYRRFALKYPQHAENWRQMAEDEMEHAQWIEVLAAEVKKGAAHLAGAKTRSETVASFLKYLRSIADQIETQPVPAAKAYTLVFDVEKSLLERRIFSKFEGDCPEVSRILRILEYKQQAHIDATQDLATRVVKKG